MPRKKLICPKCGSTNALNIIYGMPAPEAVEASNRGKVILGGCCIMPDSPYSIDNSNSY